MKRQRRMLSGETHYSQPLTHRQRAKGLSKRYVSFSAARMSTCLGCWKEELHNKIRREDNLLIKNLDEEDTYQHFETGRHFNHLDLEGEVVYSTSTIKEVKEEVAEDFAEDFDWEAFEQQSMTVLKTPEAKTDPEYSGYSWLFLILILFLLWVITPIILVCLGL